MSLSRVAWIAPLAIALATWARAVAPPPDTLPPMPPYCEAGHSGEFNHGSQTASGSSYCLDRAVLDTYATPPEGWSPFVATFNHVTTFFPSALSGPQQYPHVVVTYVRGNPRGYPFWAAETVGAAMNGGGNHIKLVRLHDCPSTTFTCEYEVQDWLGSAPGNPADWYEVSFEERVDGNGPGNEDLYGFANIGVGIGVVADGNHRPEGTMFLTPTSSHALSYRATVQATDRDGDAIASYSFDWGDGAVVESALPTADHTYAAPGEYAVRVTFTDARGAIGSVQASPSVLMEVSVVAPSSVPVGGQIQVDVTITHRGMTKATVSPYKGFRGTPLTGLVRLVSEPPVAPLTLDPGGSITRRYVYEALADGAVTLFHGAYAKAATCTISCAQTLYGIPTPIALGSGTLPSTTTTTAVGGGTTSTTTTTLPDPCDLPGLSALACRIGTATDEALCGGALAGAKVERDLKSGLAAVEGIVQKVGVATKAAKRRTLLGKAGAKLRRLAKTAKRGIKNDAACAADVQGMLSAFQASVNQAKR